VLGAIAYVAYRKAKRKSRVRRQSSPETDAVMWLLGATLVFWPIALAWVIHEGLQVKDKTKYWLMALVPGIVLLTLIPLGWELYFVYGFVAAATTVTIAAMEDEEA
jgi:O-antigen/teichoic acid export membrane protein